MKEEKDHVMTLEEFDLIAGEVNSLNLAGLFEKYPQIGRSSKSIWSIEVVGERGNFRYGFRSPTKVDDAAPVVALFKRLLDKAKIAVPDEELY